MAQRFNKCVILFSVVCYQILLVHSTLNISKLMKIPDSKEMREIKGVIKLSGIVNVRKYVDFDCEKICPDVYGNQSPVHVSILEVKVRTDMNTVNCQDGEWILKWDIDDLGKQYGDNSCATRTHLSSCENHCSPCICVLPYTNITNFNKNVVKSFSLYPQESEKCRNRVVTGYRFRYDDNNIIQLEIQQGKLLPDGSVKQERIWSGLKDFKQLTKEIAGSDDLIRLEYGKDYLSFSYDTRTLFLDEIFVPDDYVVTGVRFVEIDPSESHKGLKLQVQGTKYDSMFQLRENSERWFDYTDRINIIQNFSYKWKRREIRLDNCTDPSQMSCNIEISDTNRFVRFRATDMRKNSEKHMIPFISNKSAEIHNNLPLRGLGLSYKGKEGYGGYVITKVFPHNSLIYKSIRIRRLYTSSAARNYCQFFAFVILFSLSFSLVM